MILIMKLFEAYKESPEKMTFKKIVRALNRKYALRYFRKHNLEYIITTPIGSAPPPH